jgi:hypothetical protein
MAISPNTFIPLQLLDSHKLTWEFLLTSSSSLEIWSTQKARAVIFILFGTIVEIAYTSIASNKRVAEEIGYIKS